MRDKGNVVITGGAGFVGSHAAEYFKREGWTVVAVDNLSRPSVSGLNVRTSTYNLQYLKSIGIETKKTSVLNKSQLAKIIYDADAVIHTAGQVAVTKSLEDPANDFDINVRGTFNVLEACRASNKDVCLVFSSTNKVYGENVNDIRVKRTKNRYSFADSKYTNGISETFSVDNCKHSPYGSSKLAADIYVQEYGKTYGLRTACFRMSCIYGDRQFGNEDQGWVAHFVLSALFKKAVTIFGDGRQVRDLLYVDDLIEAYSAFVNSRTRSTVFNIGGGIENTISLVELVRLLEDRLGSKMKLKYGPWRNSDQRVYISDISKIKEVLGWYPKTSVRKGVEKLIVWAESSLM